MNYIRRGGEKKKNQLRQKENALRGDIGRQATRTKIESSAEKVRAAQLGVIKALVFEYNSNQREDEQANAALGNLQEAREYWEAISHDEIVEIYSHESAVSDFVDRKRLWNLKAR